MYVYVSINSDKKPCWVFLEHNEHDIHLYDLTISFGTLSENEDFTIEGISFDAIEMMYRMMGEKIDLEKCRRTHAKT